MQGNALELALMSVLQIANKTHKQGVNILSALEKYWITLRINAIIYKPYKSYTTYDIYIAKHHLAVHSELQTHCFAINLWHDYFKK